MQTVWGRANSLNVQKVMWTLGEIGLVHERIPTGGSFGGNNDAGYLSHNPTGLVPTLRDGDVIIWESNTIVRYLTAKYDAGGLWPEDPALRSQADRWMDWVLSTGSPSLGAVLMPTVRSPRGTPRPEGFSQAVSKLHAAFGLVEDALSHSAYIAGDRLTIGDIAVGVSVARYLRLPVELPSRPRLEAYFERLQQRPAFARHVMIPLGSCKEEWDAIERQHG